MDSLALQHLGLGIDDVGAGRFHAKCIKNFGLGYSAVISYKAHAFVRCVASDLAVECWNLSGFPSLEFRDTPFVQSGDVGFIGDADPSAVVQYLMCSNLAKCKLAKHEIDVQWKGANSRWLRCLGRNLQSGGVDSRSIRMNESERRVWKALRSDVSVDTVAILGKEIVDALDRGIKFELEAFDLKHESKDAYESELLSILGADLLGVDDVRSASLIQNR